MDQAMVTAGMEYALRDFHQAMVTAGMEYALRDFQSCTTFGGYDPTWPMIAGAKSSPDFQRGICLGIELVYRNRRRTLDLRYAS